MTSPIIGFDDGTTIRDGTATLGWAATKALQLIDNVFVDWAAHMDALEMTPPPLLAVGELASLDVYRNFPHLSMVAATLDPRKLPDDHPTALAPDALQRIHMALPSAVCYSLYLSLRGQALSGNMTLTAVGTCFRNEEHFEGLRRLRSFRMREIVMLGRPEHVRHHLEELTELIVRFTSAAGLEVRREASNDPFFDPDSVQAVWQQLDPVKYEFRFDDLAIASANEHRKFFGDRCAITLDGMPVSTGCVAMGLERWVQALAEHYHGNWEEAHAAIEAARAAVSGI